MPVAASKPSPGGRVPMRVNIVGSEGSELPGALMVYLKNWPEVRIAELGLMMTGRPGSAVKVN